MKILSWFLKSKSVVVISVATQTKIPNHTNFSSGTSFFLAWNIKMCAYFLLCSSSLVYIKLLILWSLVLLADYFLEFRFEYLWPFWLFLRSVYDSFKYQGLVSAWIDIHADQANLWLSFVGILSILHLHCHHVRHDLLSVHPGSLAVLCSQHLRLGPVCLAHR